MSLFPSRSQSLHKNPHWPDSRLHGLLRIYWVGSICLTMTVLLISTQGWSQMVAQETPAGTIVAAGFGYQSGEISTITVKVYDAVSGEVLTDDAFDLDVKEEGSGAHSGQERIFAGGVGLGATDLSNFVLRVYDAKSGQFQWEGQLNLKPNDGSGRRQMVSNVNPRHATITKIHSREASGPQPSFLLRALDPSTGGLLWEDEFSTDGASPGQGHRVANRLMAQGGNTADSRTFDFRIRMRDISGREILWEDQVVKEEADEATPEAADDQAHMLPAWPRVLEQALDHTLQAI
jgi:hypothetical protein